MSSHFPARLLLALGVALSSAGCGLIGGPRNSANIELRKENAGLRDKVAGLERQAQADAATIRALEQKSGTVTMLPRDRLTTLFTTHDIKLFRLTGGADLDPRQPGHEGLKVHVAPTDGDGDPIKAAGTFTVEAFDLSRGDGAKVGTWTFDPEAGRRQWTSVLNRYNYVLTCPWQAPPTAAGLHLVVTFVDELTRGTFKQAVDVTVELPPGPATSPTTAPAATSGAPGR